MNNSWCRIREHVSIIKILSRNRNRFRYHGPFSFAFYKYCKFYAALHVERGPAEATEVWPSSQPTLPVDASCRGGGSSRSCSVPLVAVRTEKLLFFQCRTEIEREGEEEEEEE